MKIQLSIKQRIELWEALGCPLNQKRLSALLLELAVFSPIKRKRNKGQLPLTLKVGAI